MRRRLWGRWRLAPTFVVAPHARLMFITSYFVFAVALVLPFTGQGALWPLGWRFEDVDPAQVNICDVRNYGAKGDCVTKDTNALRDALIDCGGNATPGAPAAVLLQDGCFLSGMSCLAHRYTPTHARRALCDNRVVDTIDDFNRRMGVWVACRHTLVAWRWLQPASC